jgi:cytochrome c5
MNRPTARILVACLILLLAWGSIACAGPQQPAPTSPAPTTAAQPDGAALLQARCTRCHTLDRVQQAPRTASEWQTVVARMRSKGAQRNDAEAEALVQHLARTFVK